jgi:hypothetical protein
MFRLRLRLNVLWAIRTSLLGGKSNSSIPLLGDAASAMSESGWYPDPVDPPSLRWEAVEALHLPLWWPHSGPSNRLFGFHGGEIGVSVASWSQLGCPA